MAREFENDVWVNKYKPKQIKNVVLPTTLKSFFTKIINKKDIPNLLLYSNSPGPGKTSTAKSLINDLDADYIYINGSKSGIDTLRTTIEKFAYSKSMNGEIKIVLIDEADRMSAQLMDALRADIEQYTSCRFILTANYVSRIIEPLRSRCQEINYNFNDAKTKAEMIPKIVKRITGILQVEKVEYNPATIEKLVNLRYPDIRKCIQLCQQYSNTYGIIDDNIFNFQEIDDIFFEYIENNKLTDARKYILDKNLVPDEMYRKLFDGFVPRLAPEFRSQAILIIDEGQYRSAFVMDKEITFISTLVQLMGLK